MTEQVAPIPSFDERHYHGWTNRWPFESVVAFVMRNFGESVHRSHVRILDLGCGSGHHLRFLAEEGFDYYGVDASSAVVSRTSTFLREMRFDGSRVFKSEFSVLPFGEGMFDAVIDRGSLVCNRKSDILRILPEVRRVLKTGGLLYSTMLHTDSASRQMGEDIGHGDVARFTGRLAGAGVLHYTSENEIVELYSGFRVRSLVRHDSRSLGITSGGPEILESWLHVTCEK